MNSNEYINKIRDAIAKDAFPYAIQLLRTLFEHSPKLNEALIQSARMSDISRKVRLGIIDNDVANLTKNQIRIGVLELLDEFEVERTSLPQVEEELEYFAASYISGKNIVSGNMWAGNNIEIGDNTIDINGTGNLVNRGAISGAISIVNNIPLPEKVKSAEEFYEEGINYSNMNPPDYIKALESFNSAIYRKADYEDAIVALGHLRMRQNDFLAAINCFKSALNINPSDCIAMYNLSLSYVKVQQREKAFVWLKKSKDIGCDKLIDEIDLLYSILLKS